MTSLAALVLLAAQTGAPSLKPLVIVTNREVGSTDRVLLEAVPEDRERQIRIAKYDVREFKAFTLVSPHDLLHVEATKVQTGLLRAITQKAKAGERVVDVASLDPEAAKMLRASVSQIPGLPPDLANAADLRFSLSTVTTMRMGLDGKTLPLTIYPKSPGVGKDKARMELPPGTYLPGPGRQLAHPPAEQPGSEPSPSRLTFLLPKKLDGTAGMDWIAEAQTALAKEAHEARKEWDAAHTELLAALQGDIDADYASAPGDKPRFEGLTKQRQWEASQLFGQNYNRVLGGREPLDWLRSAQTMGVRTEPTLKLHIASGGNGTTMESTDVNPVPLTCPIGP